MNYINQHKKIVKIKFLIICICLLFSSGINGQLPFEKNKYKRASIAYGYIKGQEIALLKIRREVPMYANDALIVELAFKAKFNKVQDIVAKYLITELGRDMFDSLFSTLIENSKSILNRIEFNEENAIIKLDEIKKANNWDIPSPYLEYLLSFKYYEQSHLEFLDGFKYTYNTLGHSKSKGTNWQIKVPKTWVQSEGDRPNIIQKFNNDLGTGKASIMLMVRTLDLPPNYKITKQEIEQLYTEKDAKDMVEDGNKFISFSKMTFDGIKGGLLVFEQIGENLDISIKIRIYSFYFLWDKHLYFLQCSVSTADPKVSLDIEGQKYLPVFRMVASSIVILNKYKN